MYDIQYAIFYSSLYEHLNKAFLSVFVEKIGTRLPGPNHLGQPRSPERRNPERPGKVAPGVPDSTPGSIRPGANVIKLFVFLVKVAFFSLV